MGLKERFGVKSRPAASIDADSSAGTDVITGEAVNPDAELRRFRKQHQWDPFLDIDKLDAVDHAIASGDAKEEAIVDSSLIQEDSPYAEVRASVRP